MKKSRLTNDVLKGLLATAAFALVPHLAFAQDLNDSVVKTVSELSDVPDVINACFYIGGAAFVGSGLLKLKAYADSPVQNPVGQGLGRVTVGAALLALPYIAASLINTFGFSTGKPTYETFNPVQ